MATQADVDRVQAAIATLLDGDRVTAVSAGDEATQFQSISLAELRAEEERLKSELVTTPRTVVVRLRRGLES